MADQLPRRRKLLPFEDWPEPDRAAWESLFAEGDIFEDAGHARHWRPATRRTNQQHYARWLGWLAECGQLDQNAAPARRVTPDQVRAYGAQLIETLAPCTAASALIGLKAVIKAMAPEEDWRWLMDLTNRCNTLAKPSVDRRPAMRPVGEINRAARAELDRLLTTPLTRRIDRVAYRDTLMILLLAACPIRLRNLAGLQIGEHLQREGERWTIRISEEESKNAQRLNYLLPRHMGPYLVAYLERVRPRFRPSADCTALWLGFQGNPLCAHSIYCRIVLVTKRLYGSPINPHLFRDCAATSLVEEAPEDARLAAPLLGHRYFETTERYYVKAGQITASRQINDILGRIAADLDADNLDQGTK